MVSFRKLARLVVEPEQVLTEALGAGRVAPTVNWSSRAAPTPPDLESYATSRGLTWGRERRLMPFNCLFDFEDGVNLNTMAGVLPGGEHGAIGHRLLGRDYRNVNNEKHKIRESATFAAVMVPETKTTLVALNLRAAQVVVDATFGIPLERIEDEHDWRIDRHERTDATRFSSMWNGELGAWLRARYGWGPERGLLGMPEAGGRLDVRAGIVSLWAPGYLTDPQALDELAEGAATVARQLRQLCHAAPRSAAFEEPLAPPRWVLPSPQRPSCLDEAVVAASPKRIDKFAGGPANYQHILDPGGCELYAHAGVRDFARSYAEARGLAMEDGRSFDLAFARLPFSGWTQCAWRGTGTGGAYRLAVSAQRPYLVDVGAASGAIVGLAPARPATPDRPLRFDADLGAFTAVVDGLQLVWVSHSGMSVNHEQLDAVRAKLDGVMA